jgi:uncharacterized membrane protein SpoIIM required for sporulation
LLPKAIENLKLRNPMNRFIDERKDNWQRLEDLLGLLQGTSLRGLSKLEVREFGELYRRAATDLAIARAETRDPKLINYLNSLVIRAHGKIYRAEGEGKNIVKKFFLRDLPQAFRNSLTYTLLSFGTFTLFAVLSFLLCFYDSEFGLILGLDQVRVDAETNRQWWLSINEANQIASSQILTNNIRVALYAFAFGALLGIGAFYILMLNGLQIGGALGVCFRTNPAFGNELVTFMVGHGVIELTCIFIAGGAGMMIGYAIINPGDLTRSQALKKAGMEAAKLVIGCAVFLVIAGLIEGFVSPSGLPPAVKVATGIVTGIAMFSYLFLVGRRSSVDS